MCVVRFRTTDSPQIDPLFKPAGQMAGGSCNATAVTLILIIAVLP